MAMQKQKTANARARLACEQEIETLRKARSGERFVYESEIWRIGRRATINWAASQNLNERVAPELLASARKVMAELVEEVSEGYARGIFDQLIKLLQHCSDKVSITSFEARRGELMKERLSKNTRRNYFICLKAGLIAWSDGRYPGLESKLPEYLESLYFGKSEHGRAVRERCPIRGPFTDAEEMALVRWLHEAYADCKVGIQHYGLLLLLIEFGARPVELGALRAGDIQTFKDQDGSVRHRIRLPSAKGGREYRKVFRDFDLREDLVALLRKIIENGQSRLSNVWGETIPSHLRADIPLFTGRRLDAAGDCNTFARRVTQTPQTFDLSVAMYLRETFAKCPVTTQRLEGELLPLSAYRFRRTFATRLAEAGADDDTIASAMGHSSTWSVRIYTAHTYETQEACDAIMSEAWIPVFDLVSERLLESPIAGQARVHVSKNEEVGNCEQVCGGGILTCYSCPKFRPFVDAPHEQALHFAETLKQSRIDAGLSGAEVDSLNLPIAAIKATMRACDLHRSRSAVNE